MLLYEGTHNRCLMSGGDAGTFAVLATGWRSANCVYQILLRVPTRPGVTLKERHPDWDDAAIGYALGGLRDFMVFAMKPMADRLPCHQGSSIPLGTNSFSLPAAITPSAPGHLAIICTILPRKPVGRLSSMSRGLSCIEHGIDRKNPRNCRRCLAIDENL